MYVLNLIKSRTSAATIFNNLSERYKGSCLLIANDVQIEGRSIELKQKLDYQKLTFRCAR